MGGWLTDGCSWRWLFLGQTYVQVSLALVAVTVWSWFDIDRPDWSLRRNFDAIGLALMAAFLGALEYVLEEGERWDWLSDPTIAWCAVISGGGGGAVLLAHAGAARPAGGAARVPQRQFRVRLACSASCWG